MTELDAIISRGHGVNNYANKEVNSTVSFDSLRSPVAPRLRAATMMKDTMSAHKSAKKSLTREPSTHGMYPMSRDHSPDAQRYSIIKPAHTRNGSEVTSSTKGICKPSALKLDDASFKLPDLGRTVSHSITPGPSRVYAEDLDLKLKDSLAKNSFLKIDELMLSQIR